MSSRANLQPKTEIKQNDKVCETSDVLRGKCQQLHTDGVQLEEDEAKRSRWPFLRALFPPNWSDSWKPAGWGGGSVCAGGGLS